MLKNGLETKLNRFFRRSLKHLKLKTLNKMTEIFNSKVQSKIQYGLILIVKWLKKTNVTPTNMVTLSIRQYLEIPLMERRKDPLEFWRHQKQMFLELYEMATKYLSIPGTLVPSEQVFSKTGQITNLRSNRLLPKNLDEIIFLHSCV